MLGVRNDRLREASLLRASDRGKRRRGRQLPFLIEREVVTSRCHGNKISASQQIEVPQIWHKNDIYIVFPVPDCTQEQDGSPYFSSSFDNANCRVYQDPEICYHGN